MADFRPNAADQVLINGAMQISAMRIHDPKMMAMIIDMLNIALPNAHVEHRWIGPLAQAVNVLIAAHRRRPEERHTSAHLDLDHALEDLARWRLAESWARFEEVKGRAA